MENGDEESMHPLREMEHKQEGKQRKWHSAMESDNYIVSKSPYSRDQRIYKMLRGWYLRHLYLARLSMWHMGVLSAVLSCAFIVCVSTFPVLFTLQAPSGTTLRCFIDSYTTTPHDPEPRDPSYKLPKIQLTLLARLDDGTPGLKQVKNTELFGSHSQAVEAGETYRNTTFKCYRRIDDQAIVLGTPMYELTEAGILFTILMVVISATLVASFVGLFASGARLGRSTGRMQLKRQCENIGLVAPDYNTDYNHYNRAYDDAGPWVPEPEDIQQTLL